MDVFAEYTTMCIIRHVRLDFGIAALDVVELFVVAEFLFVVVAALNEEFL